MNLNQPRILVAIGILIGAFIVLAMAPEPETEYVTQFEPMYIPVVQYEYIEVPVYVKEVTPSPIVVVPNEAPEVAYYFYDGVARQYTPQYHQPGVWIECIFPNGYLEFFGPVGEIQPPVIFDDGVDCSPI